jgi:hypothetical protein
MGEDMAGQIYSRLEVLFRLGRLAPHPLDLGHRCDLSSKIFSMSSSAADGLSWLAFMRMVCSIVESAAVRINNLIRWASGLSSSGSGKGMVRISRFTSSAALRSPSHFFAG